ncbi:MAG: DAK2 domain-containing protein [Bacillota bacterium]
MNTTSKSTLKDTLHVNDFKKMILGANYFFEREVEKINALNVFPVPDGDTGTNMIMTLKAATEGTMEYKGSSVGELSDIVASRALMGARGNSGVILSQILRGIARGLRRKDYITAGELSKAFQYGVVYAYRAVSKPVEGTILTVAREMARGIRSASRQGESLNNSIEAAIKNGKSALARTTDMLPALKEAEVVDAGGLGLLVFVEGCLYSLRRSMSDVIHHKDMSNPEEPETFTANSTVAEEIISLEFPYCTELIVKSEEGAFYKLKDELSALGESLLFAEDANAAKIHIHTANPGLVLEKAKQYGTLHDIKIDNMLDQQKEKTSGNKQVENPIILPGPEKMEPGLTGIISVSFGEGFREIFLSLGADEIVFGGQTMNPNVTALLDAVESLDQESAIILPNNKNIIMVAEQVKALTEKKVEVLETRTLPEGLAALLSYNPNLQIEENLETMRESMSKVTTGLVTCATRNAVIQGKVIKHGQFLGLCGKDIITSRNKLDQAALDLARAGAAQGKDILTIFYGQDVERKDASSLAKTIAAEYPGLEIELQYGGQPIYYYILSIE